MEDLYNEAIVCYNTGDYEKAIECLERCTSTSLVESLKNECKKALKSQYLYLIKENIKENRQSETENLVYQYIQKIGKDQELMDLIKKENLDILDTPIKSGQYENKQFSRNLNEEFNSPHKGVLFKSFSAKIWLVILFVVLILLGLLVSFIVDSEENNENQVNSLVEAASGATPLNAPGLPLEDRIFLGYENVNVGELSSAKRGSEGFEFEYSHICDAHPIYKVMIRSDYHRNYDGSIYYLVLARHGEDINYPMFVINDLGSSGEYETRYDYFLRGDWIYVCIVTEANEYAEEYEIYYNFMAYDIVNHELKKINQQEYVSNLEEYLK